MTHSENRFRFDSSLTLTALQVVRFPVKLFVEKVELPVTLKFGATLLSASVNQMSPRLMHNAAETSARLYRLPETQPKNFEQFYGDILNSLDDL